MGNRGIGSLLLHVPSLAVAWRKEVASSCEAAGKGTGCGLDTAETPVVVPAGVARREALHPCAVARVGKAPGAS